MNILILGSQGFIGSHLSAYFIAKGFAVTGCDLIENPGVAYDYQKVSILSPDFDSLFSGKVFNVCINASGSGNISFSINHPLSDFEANAMAVAKVLDTLRKYQTYCKYIQISSAAVYGNPKTLPVKESDPVAPVSPYGFHKWISEIICREYHQLYDIPIAIIRPFSVYGNGLKKQLLWDICQKLHKNNSINLFGSGKETRDFIHISDLAEIMTQVIENGQFECNVYNAATGTETSIWQVADIFIKNFPGQKQISFSGEIKKGDPLNWKADIGAIARLGFKPKKVLGNAIADYINWYHSVEHE